MADVKKAWDNLLDVLGDRWNLMGLDLKNEPHGKATWGFGDKTTDWCVVWGGGGNPSNRHTVDDDDGE